MMILASEGVSERRTGGEKKGKVKVYISCVAESYEYLMQGTICLISSFHT